MASPPRSAVPTLAIALGVGLVVTASACTPPARLRGPVADVTPRDAQAGVGIGERVRWGGVIVSVKPGRTMTCFEILSRPLDVQARPLDTDDTDGRFIACARGFYDPEVYKEGREVTVIGTVRPPTTGEIGEYEYEYPRLDAEVVYLWPERRRDYPPPYYYDPWWGPYWGFGWYGTGVVPRHGRDRH